MEHLFGGVKIQDRDNAKTHQKDHFAKILL